MKTMATRDIYETDFDEDVQTESNANQCPECDGHVTTNTVETVCEDCGPVIDEQRSITGRSGGRTTTRNANERARPGFTAARHDRGLDGDRSGNRREGEQTLRKKRQRLARMRREQTRGRFQSKAERNLAHGLGEVRRIASVLELSGSVRDQARQLFRSAQTEDPLRGRSIEAIAAASIYGVCRCNGHSRLLDDVVDAARVEQSRVTNAYKTLNTELGLPTQPVRPSEFIPVSRQNLAFQMPSGVEQWYSRSTIEKRLFQTGVVRVASRRPAFTKLHRNTEGHSHSRELQMLQGCQL